MTQGERAAADRGRAIDAGDLAALSHRLPMTGTRDILVEAVRAHLPGAFRECRVALGILDERGSRLEMHHLASGAPASRSGETYVVSASCLDLLRAHQRRSDRVFSIHELGAHPDPRTRRLVADGWTHTLLSPVTLGPATVGVVAVTTRGDIRPEVRDLTSLLAAVLSTRAHLLTDTPPDDATLSLEAQVSQLRTTARVLEHTDSLTHLPNRASAFQAIAETRARSQHGAFAIIDLDHLKMTNDRFGHSSGDTVLRDLATRLHELAEASGLEAFRVGGDEFGVLGEDSPERLQALLTGLAQDLADRPVTVDGQPVHVGFSAGVCALHGFAQGIEGIVSRAESAAYEAKRSGRGRVLVHVAAEDGGADTHGEMRRMDAVRGAVLDGRLQLVAQPVIALGDQPAPMDAEVLVRLVDDSGRLLLPDDFVVLAERYDVVSVLDRAVVQRVVRALGHGCLERRVSCNVSPHSMLDGTFVDWAEDLVRSAGVGHQLVLELTERLPVGTTEAVRDGMHHLAGSGVHFALDDFGAGTTSYGNLRDLPLDVLKVDGTLVRGSQTSPVDMAMLRATLDVTEALGIRTVAEGVETAEQLATVTALGADSVQGYYVGMPRPWPGHAP